MHPAENANDPACADVIVRLPDEIGELKRRNTNAQSTGAWGDPAGVLLYCGIEPSGPTTDQCVSVNGIDWIMDDSEAPLFRFEAYGREPGLRDRHRFKSLKRLSHRRVRRLSLAATAGTQVHQRERQPRLLGYL